MGNGQDQTTEISTVCVAESGAPAGRIKNQPGWIETPGLARSDVAGQAGGLAGAGSGEASWADSARVSARVANRCAASLAAHFRRDADLVSLRWSRYSGFNRRRSCSQRVVLLRWQESLEQYSCLPGFTRGFAGQIR